MAAGDFTATVLYDQTCTTEEGMNILSTIYAIRWTYPGALTQTTARLRITCIYSYEASAMIFHAGTIEKWRNEGWGLIDEYHDDRGDLVTPHEYRDRMINHAHSFLMGVPLTVIDADYEPTDNFPFTPSSKPPATPGVHGLKVIDYNKKKTEKNKKDPKGKLKKDDNDFDWV